MNSGDTSPSALARLTDGCCRLVVAGGVIVCGSTFLSLFAEVHWFCDLFTHFRIQYLASLVAAIAIVIWRYRRWAFVFAVVAAFNLAAIIPFYLSPAPHSIEQAAKPYRALFVNVNSRLGDTALTRQMIERYDPDVVVLAEVSPRWVEELQPLRTEFPFVIMRPRRDNFGIALLSRLRLVDSETLELEPSGVPSHPASRDWTVRRIGSFAAHRGFCAPFGQAVTASWLASSCLLPASCILQSQ